MKPRLKKSLNALKEAYENGAIKANHCKKCAVGTIVAASDLCGGDGYEWYGAMLDKEYPSSVGLDQIEATGYTLKQLTLIEDTFETNAKSTNEHKEPYHVYKGLVAVIKVLCRIDRIPVKERDQIIKDFGL